MIKCYKNTVGEGWCRVHEHRPVQQRVGVVCGIEYANARGRRRGLPDFDHIVHAQRLTNGKGDGKKLAYMNRRMTSLNMPLTNQ